METEGPFDDIRKHAQTGNEPKAKVNAVLEVITEAIRTEKQNPAYEPTYIDYFIAFMTTLRNDNQHITEIFTLLKELLPYLPTNVKRSKCVETLDFLLNGCSENHELINNSAARSLIAILGHMINEQEITEDVWNNRTIQRSFTVLMNYLIDTNGKIRKCSQDVIKQILKNQKAAKVTFAWKALCSYLCDLLDAIDEDSNTSVLQCLSFLYGIIEEIPDEFIPKLFESLLQARQHHYPFLDQCCLRPITRLLSTTRVFEASFLQKLHEVLLQYSANIEETEPTVQYISCLIRCCQHFYPDAHNATAPLPCDYSIENDVQMILSYYMCNTRDIHQAIQLNLSDLYQFLTHYVIPESSHQKLIELYQGLFEFKYQHAWISIIKSFTDLVSFSAGVYPRSFYESLRMLLGIYENSIKGDAKFTDVINTCLGVAMEKMGLEHFLTALPLVDDGDSIPSVERYFLMDILKQHLKHTSSTLHGYQTLLVPIAETAAALQESAPTSFEKLHYTQIIEDIVSLFPANCVSCTDLPTTLPTVASSLVMALSTSTNISVTMSLCKGLLILIKANQKVLKITFEKNIYIHNTYNEDEDDDEDEEELKNKTNDREDIDVDQLPFLDILRQSRAPPCTEDQAKQNLDVLKQFSEQILPVLFPVYERAHGIGEQGHIEAIYIIRACIEGFMSISSPSLVHQEVTQFLKALLTILNQNNDSMTEQSTISQALIYSGVLSTVIPFAPSEDLSLIYRCLKPQLTQDNFPALQKRVYFCLMYLCKYHSDFLLNEEHYQDIFTLLFNTILSVSVNSKKNRLKCIYYLIMSMSPSSSKHLSLLPHILPEIILCTKDTNKKIRDISFDICIYVGHLLGQKQGQIVLDNGQQFSASLSEYYKILVGCMTSTSPHLQSASIQVLTRVLYAYKTDSETQSSLVNIMHVIYELMKQKNREVIKSCLGFVKTAVKILPDEVLMSELKNICEALLLWSKDPKNRFRMKVRIIMENLMKRVGGEVLKNYIPPSDTSLLNYLQKEMKKKQKGKKKEQVMDEDEDDAYLSNQRQQTKREESRRRYINERDTIVDLMDRYNTSKNITIRKERVEKREDDIEINSEGKIVVHLEEDENPSKKSTKKDEEESEEEEEKEEEKKKSPLYKRKDLGGRKRKDESGERFKAKKAGGDVKRNGMDPYAYVRLDPRSLSKKKRGSTAGQFKNLIGAAKKGAKLGKKDAQRMRQNRK